MKARLIALCALLPLGGAARGDALAEAEQILQSRYIDYAGLQVRSDDHLSDLLTRSQGRILLGSTPATAVAPIRVVRLPNGVFYCRMASFEGRQGLVVQLGSAPDGVILDLRSNIVRDDFEGAAAVAGLFTPAGTPLFAIRDAQDNKHAYASPLHAALALGPLAVLIDSRTSGAAEALAACLKANGALIIGCATAGYGAEFEDHRLISGQVLRYLAGQVLMADGNDLWRHAVQPDIGLNLDPVREQAALALIGRNQVLDVIGESAGSHRLSEAALVRGEDPEVEAYLAPETKTSSAPVVQDVCLIAALDSLKAIRLSQGSSAAKTLQ